MTHFKFKTVNGIPILKCHSESESDAWIFLSETKRLAIDEVKKLYVIEKIENKNDD